MHRLELYHRLIIVFLFFYLLGLVGIGCISLGIGSAFGLVMATGEYYVAFVGVVPFLILGVGIDDVFIIIGGKLLLHK